MLLAPLAPFIHKAIFIFHAALSLPCPPRYPCQSAPIKFYRNTTGSSNSMPTGLPRLTRLGMVVAARLVFIHLYTVHYNLLIFCVCLRHNNLTLTTYMLPLYYLYRPEWIGGGYVFGCYRFWFALPLCLLLGPP